MISMTPAEARRFLAEEIRVAANIRALPVIEALATVPREQFLPPGPWDIRGGEASGASHRTDDADPSHVYHDVSVAIDLSRHLFNGQPSVVARWLAELDLSPGDRVVHIGCATGYFTALIAHIVGPTGTVDAIEVDQDLAARAALNLSNTPWVRVHHNNGGNAFPIGTDAILVHAGATHLLDVWLDALSDGGRLLVPLTAEFPGMAANLGKGVMLLVTRQGAEWNARILPTPVAIYSLQELRDARLTASFAQAMVTGALHRAVRVRRDTHDSGPTCVLHGPQNCVST